MQHFIEGLDKSWYLVGWGLYPFSLSSSQAWLSVHLCALLLGRRIMTGSSGPINLLEQYIFPHSQNSLRPMLPLPTPCVASCPWWIWLGVTGPLLGAEGAPKHTAGSRGKNKVSECRHSEWKSKKPKTDKGKPAGNKQTTTKQSSLALPSSLAAFNSARGAEQKFLYVIKEEGTERLS